METIKIQCPLCYKKGFIEIEERLVKTSQRGITAFNVLEHLICDHSFVAYIDKNLMVRDCFIVDFTIELPQFIMDGPSQESEIPDEKMINLYLILLNFNASWVARILRCCFYRAKFVIINDLNFLTSHIINLFEFIFQNAFEINVTIMSSEDYKKYKKNYNDYVILDKDKVLNDKKKILKTRSLKIENKIVQNFLNEIDQKTSLIILKNDVLKAFRLSNDASEYVINLGEQVPLDARELNAHLNQMHNTKIQKSYLEFLVDIVRYYHEIKIIDAADFMTGL